MALIKCSECGKEISDKAKTCPNCGNLIEEEINKKFLEENKDNISFMNKNNFKRYYNELDKTNPEKDLKSFTNKITFSVLIPILGLYYYFDYKSNKKTKMANDILWTCIACPIVWFIIIFVIMSLE